MSFLTPDWNTKALNRKAAPLSEDVEYTRAFQGIEKMNESVGMKHLLINWVTDLRLENKKIPDKLLSRKKSASFLDSVAATLRDDLTIFRISGMINMICASLVCMFIKAVLSNNYLINFSVDALIATAALVILLLDLTSQLRTVGFYGSIKDFVLLDGLAVVLWLLLTYLLPAFDTSLIVFFAAYYFEKKKFVKMQDTFLSENKISIEGHDVRS
ncbi:hypothetical protein AAK899_04580 [Erysipelotrichaceae bacterium 51-3]